MVFMVLSLFKSSTSGRVEFPRLVSVTVIGELFSNPL